LPPAKASGLIARTLTAAAATTIPAFFNTIFSPGG
jgi:hypothetical protein